MNKNYTLKELADMFAFVSIEGARELALKHILDAIGYEFPVDEEREAFDAWCKANHKLATTDQFEVWKAGREELRRAINKPSYFTPEQTEKAIQELTTKEPEWIPWHGGSSPIVGEQTKFEVKYRDGIMEIYYQSQNLPLDWENRGCHYDIVAYRILD